jgi:NIPSNAP
MAYLQYSIKLHPGKLQDFVKLLNELTPVVAKHGSMLVGSYASVVGRLNTVVDLWELPSTSAIGCSRRCGNAKGRNPLHRDYRRSSFDRA